jgi:hypothetical protein
MPGRLMYLTLGVGCEVLAVVLLVRGRAMAARSRRRMEKPGSFRAGTPSYVSIAIMAGNLAVFGIYFFNRFIFK